MYQRLLVILAVQAEHAVRPQHTGRRVIVGQDHNRIKEPDVIKFIALIVPGQDVENQVAHFVEIQVPVVESGILKIFMGRPRGVDVILLFGVCAPGHAEHLGRQRNAQFFSSYDLLTKFLLAGTLRLVLGIVQKLDGVHILGSAAVFIFCHQRPGTQTCHQAGQRLPRSLIEGAKLRLLHLFQVFPTVLLCLFLVLGVKGGKHRRRKTDPVKGIFILHASRIAEDNGSPFPLPCDGLRQMRHRIGQVILLRPPLTEFHVGVVDKRL